MDRTAWIVVIFCVIGLALWTWWSGQHLPPRPAPATLSATATPATAPSASAISAPSPVPAASATPSTAPAPAFAEKIETLRNDDVELRFTNRGGGITEAILLNQIAQGDQRAALKSKEQTVIGAMLQSPDAPHVAEFTLL